MSLVTLTQKEWGKQMDRICVRDKKERLSHSHIPFAHPAE